ncbi:MAG: hypothetical protein WC178_05965 [Candidatus Paceibacterota bacterium]|jgi:hypothetical protein
MAVINPFEREMLEKETQVEIAGGMKFTLTFYEEVGPLNSGDPGYDRYWTETLGEPHLMKMRLTSKTFLFERTLEMSFQYCNFPDKEINGCIKYSYSKILLGRKRKEFSGQTYRRVKNRKNLSNISRGTVVLVVREELNENAWAEKLSRIWNIEN